MFSIMRRGFIQSQVGGIEYPLLIIGNTSDSGATYINTQTKFLKDSTGRLWIAYQKTISNIRQIFVAYSDNDGITWTEEQITNAAGSQGMVSLAIDSSNNIHIAWNGPGYGTYPSYQQIVYRKRTSGSWGSVELVTDINHGNGQYYPAIVVDSSGYVHVAWYGWGLGSYPSLCQIGYCKRTTSWGSIEVASNDGYATNGPASLDIDNSGYLHLAFVAIGYGSYPAKAQLVYRKRTSSWQTQEVLTNVDYSQGNPNIFVNKTTGNIHIAWQGYGYGTNYSGKNIYYIQRTTGWLSIENITELAEVSGGQYYPGVVMDSNGVIHVVWQGHGLGNNPSIGNIYYTKRVTTAYAEWAANRQLITDEENIQNMPSMLHNLNSDNPTFVFIGDDGSQKNIYLYKFV